MALRTDADRKLGYDDYVRIPDDGLRHEVVDGKHFVNPAPSLRHQDVLGRLFVQLHSHLTPAGRGRVFLAPLDVELNDHDIVQPDLVVVSVANFAILTESRIHGVPDLVIEILSPSSARFDRTVKREAYRRTGVPEYWIVDPESRTIEQFVLRDGRYELRPSAVDSLRLYVLPDVTIRLAEIW